MLKFDINKVVKELSTIDNKVGRASQAYGKTCGAKLVSSAKKNAPWKDETGISRQTIDSEVINGGNVTTIALRGNSGHFKYLELAHEKKYAILEPTLNAEKGEIVQGWANVIKNL